jgi:hypothetical protein
MKVFASVALIASVSAIKLDSQQVQDPSAPIDPNFDPMYNRFRYGNTFVKGSSVAQQV